MKKTFSRVLSALMVCVLVTAMVIGTVSLNTSHAESATFGQCGMNLWWYYDEYTGTLSIKGDGALWDYDLPELTPWWGFAGNIQRIVFSSGVTVIGKNAFAKCAVETIELPDTLTTIKEGAFKDCAKLVEVDASETQLTTIEAKAFAGCQSLPEEAVSLPETIVQVSDTAFDEVMAEPVKPEQPTVAPTEPTEVPTEPTVAPTEPTVEPTEPTVAPTEPTVAPTEPIVAPTEPTVEPTEPTVAPTEPTAPSEPVVETKTYTTKDHFTVTETWVDGVLMKRVSVPRDGSYTMVSTDFTADNKPGTNTCIYEDGRKSTETLTYDDAGRLTQSERVNPNGMVYLTKYAYDSATTGTVTYEYPNGRISEGVVTLHENGSIATLDVEEGTDYRVHKEYSEDGLPVKEIKESGEYKNIYYYGEDGCEEYQETFYNGKLDSTTTFAYDEDTGYTTWVEEKADGSKKTTTVYAADNRTFLSQDIEQYDEQGNLERVIHSRRDLEAGTIIEETTDSNGTTSYTVSDSYTGKVLEEKVEVRDENGNLTESKYSHVDADTGYTTTESIRNNGMKEVVVTDAEGNHVSAMITSPDGSKSVQTYKDGRLISEVVTDKNGETISTTSITGEKDGITEYTTLHADGGKYIVRSDENGKKVFEGSYGSDGYLRETVYKDGRPDSSIESYPNGWSFTNQYTWNADGSHTIDSIAQDGYTTIYVFDQDDMKVSEECYDPQGGLISSTTYKKNSDGTIEGTMYRNGKKYIQTYKDDILISRDEYNSDGIIIREQTFDENGRQTSWKTYDATGKPEGSGKTTWNSDGSYENMVFDAEGKINYVDQFVMLENGGRIYQRADTAGEKSYSCYDENGRETKHVRIGADGSLLIDNGDDGETASVSADGKWISISGQQNGDSYYFTYQFNEETGEWEENLYSGTGVFDEETGTKAGISEYAPFGDNKLLEEAKSLVTIEIPTTYEAAEETTEEETEETTTEEETEEATTEEETEETTTEEKTEETTTEEETEETTTEEKTEGTVTTETPVAETEQAA